MDCETNVIREIPVSDSLYMYVNEFHKSELDKIMGRSLVLYQFISSNGHWILEVTGDEQNVSEATSESSEFCRNVMSHVDEDILDLSGIVDLEAFTRLADQRIAQPMQVLVLPKAGTGCRLIGPRDKLAQAKERLSALAAELRTEFMTTFGSKVSVLKGDLTLQQTEAIVNPANERLQHFGGAAKAIADAAGPTLDQECQAFISDHGPLRVSDVIHTGSGQLYPRIKYVVHTVGPRSGRYPDPYVQRSMLEATFFNCLAYANSRLNVSSIAVPAIGSGIHGISKDLVAEAAFSGLHQFESTCPRRKLLTINFVNIDDASTAALLKVFRLNTRTTRQGGGSPLGAKAPQSILANPKDGTTPPKTDARPDGSGHPLSMGSNACLNIADGVHGTCEPNGVRKLNTEDMCVICMEQMLNPKELPCGHKFCEQCLKDSFAKCQPKCPSCGRLYSVMRGNQPPGTMTVSTITKSLPGYEKYDTLVVSYEIPDGTQNNTHPNPGQAYSGTDRKAYLPNNREGKEVCDLLRQAFDADLIFTVGRSMTTGLDNQVIWNDIHHKTKFTGEYGYPDPEYLSRVKEEIKAKGIVPTPAGYNCNLI